MARVGRRGRLLTRGRAPQRGATPLYAAAQGGHLEVVKLLVQANANMDASNEVREGAEGMLGAQTVIVFLAGGCSNVAD